MTHKNVSFREAASTRSMWLWFVIPMIADLILEEGLFAAAGKLYVYYGNQPLRYAAAGGIAGTPSFIVINSELPVWLTQLGGLASFILACDTAHENGAPKNSIRKLIPRCEP